MFSFRRLLFRELNKNANQIQNRNIYEQTRSGKLAWEKKKDEMRRQNKTEVQLLKENAQYMKDNLKWSAEQFRDKFLRMFTADDCQTSFKDQEIIKFYDFNEANNGILSSYPLKYKNDHMNDLNNWYVTCDADFDTGYSKVNLEVSPSGYALFSGYIDTTLPKDGSLDRTGYAYFGTYKNRRQQFFDEDTSELEDMTHICMRVRGDGRPYHIVFDTSGKMDITWFDKYQFPLFTHGGPYWQDVKIPLSKFFFNYQGFMQDEQTEFDPTTIKTIGFLATSIFNGPFKLEVDYIGFMSDSQYNHRLDYEGYYHEQATLKNIGSV